MQTHASHRALVAVICACVLFWPWAPESRGQSLAADAPVPTAAPPPMPEAAKDFQIAELRRRIDALERRLEAMAPAQIAAAPVTPQPDSGLAPQLAERALERTLVRSGALLLGAGQIELEPTLSFIRNESTANDLFVIDGGAATALGAQKRVRSDGGLDLTLRAGLPLDMQAEIALSGLAVRETLTTTVAGASQGESLNESSVGDLRLGLAKTLLRERGAWPDLIGRVTWDTATGQSKQRLSAGSGFNEIELGLTAIKRQDPLVFVGSLQARGALERGDVRPGNVYSGSANVSLAVSPETSLRMGVRYSRIELATRNGAQIPASDATPITLSLGAGSIIGRQRFIDIGVDIGLNDDAPQFGVAVTLPLRGTLPVR
jgi:hypothetical protein